MEDIMRSSIAQIQSQGVRFFENTAAESSVNGESVETPAIIETKLQVLIRERARVLVGDVDVVIPFATPSSYVSTTVDASGDGKGVVGRTSGAWGTEFFK